MERQAIVQNTIHKFKDWATPTSRQNYGEIMCSERVKGFLIHQSNLPVTHVTHPVISHNKKFNEIVQRLWILVSKFNNFFLETWHCSINTYNIRTLSANIKCVFRSLETGKANSLMCNVRIWSICTKCGKPWHVDSIIPCQQLS